MEEILKEKKTLKENKYIRYEFLGCFKWLHMLLIKCYVRCAQRDQVCTFDASRYQSRRLMFVYTSSCICVCVCV